MRQGQQNRRGRGRPNNNQTSHNQSSNNNNNRKSQNPLTRSFESTGPDVKIRGNPAHIAEKYMQLARDAQTSGDPVLAENYLQHAEHYNRIILTYREQQAAEASGQAPSPVAPMPPMPRSRFQSDDDTSEDGEDQQQTDSNGQIRGQEPQPGLYEAGGTASPRPEREPRPERSQERGLERNQDRNQDRDRGNRDRDFAARDTRDGNRDGNQNVNQNGNRDRGRDDRPYRDDRNQDRPQRRPDGQQNQGRLPERSGRDRFSEVNRGYSSDRGPDRGPDRAPDRNPDRGPDRNQERGERPPQFDRNRNDRPERQDRSERGNRFERPERPERSDRYDRHAEPGAPPPQNLPQQDSAARDEVVTERPITERPMPERKGEIFAPRIEPRSEPSVAAVESQPSVDLPVVGADAVPATRAAPRRRATATTAARFAEAAGGEAPEFLTRPVRRPRRETPAIDAAETPTDPVAKPISD